MRSFSDEDHEDGKEEKRVKQCWEDPTDEEDASNEVRISNEVEVADDEEVANQAKNNPMRSFSDKDREDRKEEKRVKQYWEDPMDEEDAEDRSLPHVVSKGQHSSCWEAEDVENNKVKESWEDEDDNILVPMSMSSKKVASNASKKKGKAAAGEKEAKLKSMEEKLCQLSLVGKANSGSNGDQSAEKSINNFIPKTESDFLKYAALISDKLLAYEHSYYYLTLLKAVMKFSIKGLKAADAKEISSTVAAISNERLKAEREDANRKWKTTAAAKKKSIYVEKKIATSLDAYSALDSDADYDYE
ncbi:Translation initiation factor eIF3 subunit [Corchorus capsularis]|uniref:Translation initiation factor eIF3 subunit n=1 Tax=Corchorus capsularis TaxID=210143 RepID=A0A1R3GS60_COCAP|nr:Translation initiation factor eIF3 subunit [Corchorus capsularis]